MAGSGRLCQLPCLILSWTAVLQHLMRPLLDLYLKDYAYVPNLASELHTYLKCWYYPYFQFYNYERPHQSLGYRTPAEVHFYNFHSKLELLTIQIPIFPACVAMLELPDRQNIHCLSAYAIFLLHVSQTTVSETDSVYKIAERVSLPPVRPASSRLVLQPDTLPVPD
jgi:hypothetical protein